MTDATIWARAFSLVGFMFVAYMLTLWAVMVFWTHRDIASRTANRAQRQVSVAMVALFHVPGFLLYLALRPPETVAESLSRQLEAEALVLESERQQTCPACGHAVSPEFVTCPFCRTAVGKACEACQRSLRTAWVLCPYCGADRAHAPSTPERSSERAPVPLREAPQPAGARRTALPTARA